MPKRKRAHHGREEVDPTQETELKKGELEKKLVHGRKVLNRALKTAKGFERQKLGKRIKLATKEQDEVEAGRLQKELEVLKTLNLSVAIKSHLYKTILKSKSIHELGLLPSYVKNGIKWDEGFPEELSAINNVTARLYNTKPVKDAMSQIMGSIYAILGIQNPSATTKSKSTERSVLEHKCREQARSAEHNIEEDVGGRESPSPDKGFGAYEVPTHLATLEPDLNSKSDLESDNTHESDDARDALVIGSSDEESNADVNRTTTNVDLNSNPGIPEQPHDTLTALSPSSQSPPPPPVPKKSTKQVQQGSSKPGSTFLPTLMGGYWSGSESATDEEDTSTRKKNRPGQQARRALWEKKFGAKANHLKGQPSGKSRDKDWDPRRGARGAGGSHFTRGKAAGKGGNAVFVKNRGQSSDENAVAVKSRARGMGKKDDAGPLHPSWEAAKKAKESKQTVAFQGKKMVFE